MIEPLKITKLISNQKLRINKQVNTLLVAARYSDQWEADNDDVYIFIK